MALEEFITQYLTLDEPFDTNQEDGILSSWFFEIKISGLGLVYLL